MKDALDTIRYYLMQALEAGPGISTEERTELMNAFFRLSDRLTEIESRACIDE